MMKSNMSIFAIPVQYGILTGINEDLNLKLIDDIYKEINNNGHELRSGVDVFQTKNGLENKYDTFENLSNLINNFISDFLLFAGINDKSSHVKDMWANLNKDPMAFHMPHSHGLNNSIFTGVYFPTSGFYLNDKNKNTNIQHPQISSKTQPNAGDLVLLDPLENIKTGLATRNTKKYPFFGNPICITPVAGSIVIFPSYLSHMVTPTKKENYTRISIAFNVEIS